MLGAKQRNGTQGQGWEKTISSTGKPLEKLLLRGSNHFMATQLGTAVLRAAEVSSGASWTLLLPSLVTLSF